MAAAEAGAHNLGATEIVEQGLKWQALGLTMADRQFIEARNFQPRDVDRAFDVPPYKLAIEGENEGPASPPSPPFRDRDWVKFNMARNWVGGGAGSGGSTVTLLEPRDDANPRHANGFEPAPVPRSRATRSATAPRPRPGNPAADPTTIAALPARRVPG